MQNVHTLVILYHIMHKESKMTGLDNEASTINHSAVQKLLIILYTCIYTNLQLSVWNAAKACLTKQSTE